MRQTTVAIAVLAAMTVIAGGSPTAPSGTPAAIGTIAPLGSPVAGVDGPTPRPSTSPTGPAAGPVSVDPTLLALLPTDIEGTKLAADANTALEIAADAALRRSVDAVAVATAFSAAATDNLTDYAVATIARLRPGVFDDAWFR